MAIAFKLIWNVFKLHVCSSDSKRIDKWTGGKKQTCNSIIISKHNSPQTFPKGLTLTLNIKLIIYSPRASQLTFTFILSATLERIDLHWIQLYHSDQVSGVTASKMASGLIQKSQYQWQLWCSMWPRLNSSGSRISPRRGPLANFSKFSQKAAWNSNNLDAGGPSCPP